MAFHVPTTFLGTAASASQNIVVRAASLSITVPPTLATMEFVCKTITDFPATAAVVSYSC